jgi:ligand-binding sensor domain-containing protein/signal transduction histidine kinase
MRCILSAAMKTCRLIAVCLLAWLAACPIASADGFSGYTERFWQAPDGLPEQTVQAFAQTGDGFLWIGTTGGLLRFDGTHFTVFDRQNTPALRENSVFCLMVAKDGTLWAGTEGGGVVSYSQGQFRSWPAVEGQTSDFVRVIKQDDDGTIWAGTDGGLLRLSGDRFSRIDGTETIPALTVHSIFRDAAGRLWAGGSRLIVTDGKTSRVYSLGSESSENQVKSILQTSDGTLWVGTVSGLNRMLPGQDRFERVQGISSTVRVLRQTPDGVLWVGTIGQGVFTLTGGKLAQITAPSALPSNTVLNLFEDKEGNFWIGTQTGMARLTRSKVNIVPLPQANDSDFETIYRDSDGSFWIGSTLLFQMRNGVLAERVLPGMRGIHVRNIYRDRSGALWAGTDGDGVFRFAGSVTSRWTNRDGLSNNFIRAITQDRDKSMWVATDNGLNHLIDDHAHVRIVSYEMEQGLAYNSTRCLLEDRSGDLWIGTDRGVSHIHNGVFVRDTATAAMAQMKVWAIHEDSDGGLWFGTRNNGLFRFRSGALAHFTTTDGLASNAIYDILEDGGGHLWMSGPNGISMVNRPELDAQAGSQTREIAPTFYSIAEMAANTEIYGGTESSGCITAAGDVWFPSNRGPIHILPFQRSTLAAPPLHVERVLADGQPVPMTGPIVLQPANSRLQFTFEPIQLRSQDGLRFRSMLTGFDKELGPATASRTADYTNLPPGKYVFRVRTFEVSNPDVVTEASVEIVQRPYFYRTWWFSSACLALVLMMIFAIYQYRVRQVRARFEAVLEERSRLAREMHDTVIQGCTGVSALLEAVAMEEESQHMETGLMEVARHQLRTTIAEAREAVWNLRHEDEGPDILSKKMEAMALQVGAEFHLPVTCSTSGTPFGISPPMAHDLLMIAREAVCNAALHGHPSQIGIGMEFTGRELVLTVSDDGCGFEPRQGESQSDHHFGLKGMRERANRWGGKFRLTSAPGNGTRVEARLAHRT